MSDLSRHARAILDAAAGADDPSIADKGRVHEALMATLNVVPPTSAVGSATATPTATAATTTVGSSIVLKLLAGVALVSSLSVAGYLLLNRGGSATQAPPAVAQLPSPELTQPAPAIETAPVQLEAPAETPAPAAIADRAPEPVAVAVAKRKKQPRPADKATSTAALDRLRAEKRLISAARRALASGEATTSLELLSQHRSKFPRGQLRAERDGTRVLALCDLGRKAAAASQARSFLRRYGKHPMAARVRSSCAATD